MYVESLPSQTARQSGPEPLILTVRIQFADSSGLSSAPRAFVTFVAMPPNYNNESLTLRLKSNYFAPYSLLHYRSRARSVCSEIPLAATGLTLSKFHC